jgi:hypothetical protein
MYGGGDGGGGRGFRFGAEASVIFVHQHGWTDLVFIARLADNPNQVGSTQTQMMRFTEFVEFFEVIADHRTTPRKIESSGFKIRQSISETSYIAAAATRQRPNRIGLSTIPIPSGDAHCSANVEPDGIL